jgi:hypothetical protein
MDYSNGKIYMIEPTCEYEDGDIYYGSTASTLVKRLSQHKNKSNKCRSKILIEKYGRDNIKIILIKYFPCQNKSELTAEEGKYQRANKCINKAIAGRTKSEYYQDNSEMISEIRKLYYHDNTDKINEYQKLYYQDNTDKILESRKLYYHDNSDKILESRKLYHSANAVQIREKKRLYYIKNAEILKAKREAKKLLSNSNV